MIIGKGVGGLGRVLLLGDGVFTGGSEDDDLVVTGNGGNGGGS